jgi:hypothetical protein
MAFVWNKDGEDGYNLSYTQGPEVIWGLIDILRSCGWTLVDKSDGLTYGVLSHSGIGAGGMNNNYAWARVRDPSNIREIVFQRGVAHYQWKFMYSAKDRFDLGFVDAVTIPTAADEVSFHDGYLYPTTFRTVFPTSGSWKVNIWGQDQSHNGGYFFCALVRLASTGTNGCLIYGDPIALNSSTGLDEDPYVLHGTNAAMTRSSMGGSGSETCGWMRYSKPNESWHNISQTYHNVVPVEDPEDNSRMVDNGFYHHQSTGLKGRKGKSKYVSWKYGNSINFGDVFEDQDENLWLIVDDIALAGWPRDGGGDPIIPSVVF